MRKGYSLHFYLQALKAASDCLRELTFDTLKNINTIVLDVSDTGSADLPCDFVDWVKIGAEVGQYVQPLVQKQGINRLVNRDSAGLPINFPNDSIINTDSVNFPFNNGWFGSYWWGNGFQDNYPWYGFNAGNIQDGFQVFRERNQIQSDQLLGATSIYLEYISDGQNSDDATQIHPYAQATIEAYIFWQFKEHNRSTGDGERQRAESLFTKEHRKLRARLNGLTKDDLMRIMRKGYSGAIKG